MRLARVLPLAAALGAAGCFTVGHPRCLRWNDYLEAPVSDETAARFATLDLKDQYTVHVCGLHDAEPRLGDAYSPVIARRGASAVLFLRTKLTKARSASDVYDAVEVLRQMQAERSYDVAGDAPLMNTLDYALGRFPTDEWKTLAANGAREIRGSAAAPR